MRIDDENKVVWCSESEMEWYVGFNASKGNTLYSNLKRIKFLSNGEETILLSNQTAADKIEIIRTISDNYEFKLEQPKKYYWCKKKEHMVWFEVAQDTYLAQDEDDGELTLGWLEGAGWKCKFTETEARDLLKDDFDKFEKVECE